MRMVRSLLHSKRHAFVDRVKILLSSGAGGDGASSMLHLHNDEFGGPGGGNGGRGGNVFLLSTREVSDLTHIALLGPQAIAGFGTRGRVRDEHGSSGENLILKLPVGTQVVDVDTNEIVFDLEEVNQQVVLLEGGQGGKGNSMFKSSICHTPLEATKGLPGNTMLTQFELKTIADCGLIGYPNAGKSSLLGAISTTKPKVAPFPFTTLRPMVGEIHDAFGHTCQVADLPGLIEGAFENRGLGHQFLRHTERTKLLALVVDMSDSFIAGERNDAQHPWEIVEAIRSELDFYSPGTSDKIAMIFANKMDLARDSQGRLLSDKLGEFRSKVTDTPIFPISALNASKGKPASGIEIAIKFLFNEVFRRKNDAEAHKRQQKELEKVELETIFQQTHRHSQQLASLKFAGASLVDQQFGGFSSGFGEPFSAYDCQSEGYLQQHRDNSLKGRYWRLSRNDEKLPFEQW